MEARIEALRRVIEGMTPAEAEAAIVDLVTPWAGSAAAARDWLAESIPSFGSTPRAMIEAGRAKVVIDHIRCIGAGGYA